ncbi:MAG: Gfo/Idh/MocA family oxidoreductase [Magnetococcus sp. WYHC-3]
MSEGIRAVNRIPLRTAVIGVGYLGRFHAMKYRLVPDVVLVGVADLDERRAKQVADELGVPAFTDYRNLLGQVDAVSVAVPTQSHYHVAGSCLEAGIHVLLEKPITTTLDEADDLVALAERQKLVLQVGHLKRFHPAVMALRESKLLSQPRFIESHRLAPFKARALDVDVISDLMIHDVDLIMNFVGSEVVGVEAIGAPVLTDKVDMAHARLKFANGCIANVTASRVASEATRRLRIFQDDNYLCLDFLARRIQVKQRGPGVMVLDGVEVPEIQDSSLPIEDYDTLEAEIRSFCEAVRRGVPPLVSGREGRKALEMVTRIQKSLKLFGPRERR